jgi:hypothetical protein
VRKTIRRKAEELLVRFRKVTGFEGGSLLVALARVGSIVVFGLLPVVLISTVLGSTLGQRTFLYDFHGDLYAAGRAIVHGRDPYRAAFLDHLAALERAGRSPSTTFAVPVYPAPGLLAATPLSLLPFQIAGILFSLLAIAAMMTGLWLLGVRDWRCYGVAFLSWPMLHSLRLGQVNEFLVLGLACVWRWRQNLFAPAAAAAAVIAAKLFLWPIGVFLVIARRYRVALLTAVVAVVGTVVAWAVISFAGITAYPRMLRDLSSVEAGAGVSLVSAGRALGVSRTVSEVVGGAITLGLLALAWWFVAREGDERRAFALAVMAALISSPLVWPHYVALVFVPIALVSPAFAPLWLVPLIAYLAPVELTHGDFWKIVPYLVIEAITIGAICRRRGSDPGAARSPATLKVSRVP